MKYLISILCVLSLGLGGCATRKTKVPNYAAPVGAEKISASIGKAQTATAKIATANEKAKANAGKIAAVVKPADLPLVKELQANLEESNAARLQVEVALAAALTDVGDYQTKVQEQTLKINEMADALGKKTDEVLYWQGKQSKALKELWIWRSIAAASVMAVGVWLGIKSGWKFFL